MPGSEIGKINASFKTGNIFRTLCKISTIKTDFMFEYGDLHFAFTLETTK